VVHARVVGDRQSRNELRGERSCIFAFRFARDAECVVLLGLPLEDGFGTQNHCSWSGLGRGLPLLLEIVLGLQHPTKADRWTIPLCRAGKYKR
jgi:hypothetical protein